MCGPNRTISGWIDEALGERRYEPYRPEHLSNPRGDVEQEVKVMYARGDIDAETFQRLRTLARSGELSRSDLARVRREVGPPPRREESTPPRQRDVATVSSLDRLYAHRSRLERSCAEAEQMLQTLEAQVRRLREQAEAAAESARLALPDERRARAFLEAKEEARGHIQALEARMASLREGLQRIEALRDELTIREAELKALESDEHLAELELRIREDLLNG